MASSGQPKPTAAQVRDAARSVAQVLGPNNYAIIDEAACLVLGSPRQTADVDIMVPKGNIKEARALLEQRNDLFEVEMRTQHIYFKSIPRVEINLLSPPASFQEAFDDSTLIITIDDVNLLKPTLLLNAKCGSILGRDSKEKKDTDAFDIQYILQWCAAHNMRPTASEVPNVTKEFVQRFTQLYGGLEDWQNLGYDIERDI